MSLVSYGESTNKLKPLNEALLPDPRWQWFSLTSKTGSRPFELADLHGRLCDFRISAAVPETVRSQFALAQNLMLYSWLVYEFSTITELQAYATLELALNECLGYPKVETKNRAGVKSRPMMLSGLLQKAVSEGRIDPKKLPAWEGVVNRRKWHEENSSLSLGEALSVEQWFQHVIKSIPDFRNSLAHGNSHLYWEASFSTLELCGDLINALFQSPASANKP